MKDADYSGEVTFGRVETKYMSNNFQFFDVTSEDYWQVGLTDIMVLSVTQMGDESLKVCDYILSQTDHCGVAIDTGTSLIAGPTQ